MRTLTLSEYADCPIDFPLDKGQLLVLADAKIGIRPAAVEDETWVLRPSSYIGALNLGELAIVVRPKIPIDRVMFLVAYSLDPRRWRQYPFDLKPDTDVLEALIPAFVRHTRQAIRRGLLQGYRREEEALHTVRGRIRFDDQINRRFGVPLPIEVAFDEFTEDIEENRMLKTALHRLAHLPVRSPQSRRDVHALRPAFNTVGLGLYRRGAPPEIQYTRLNQHYRLAVELARLIIENSSLELLHGNVTAASFLLDMNKVFERFLFVALGEALGLSATDWKNGNSPSLSLDVGGKIMLGPDLSWWSNDRCRFVGDAKYKRLEAAADIYQMLAYSTAANLTSGLLVYPAGEAEPGLYRIKHSGKTIEVASVDLNGSPSEILEEVGRLSDRVKRHVTNGVF